MAVPFSSIRISSTINPAVAAALSVSTSVICTPLPSLISVTLSPSFCAGFLAILHSGLFSPARGAIIIFLSEFLGMLKLYSLISLFSSSTALIVFFFFLRRISMVISSFTFFFSMNADKRVGLSILTPSIDTMISSFSNPDFSAALLLLTSVITTPSLDSSVLTPKNARPVFLFLVLP